MDASYNVTGHGHADFHRKFGPAACLCGTSYQTPPSDINLLGNQADAVIRLNFSGILI